MSEHTNMDIPDPDAYQAIRELEKNTAEEIKRKRSHQRFDIKSEVIIQYGDASRRLNFKMRAVTGDISRGGCQILCPFPTQVGDIYRLSFDRQAIDLQPVYARCVRCRMINEDAFEVGFTFFNTVDLTCLEPNTTVGLLD